MTKDQKAKLEKNRPKAGKAVTKESKRFAQPVVGVAVKAKDIEWANKPTKK